MSIADQLPTHVVDLLRGTLNIEFATVSAKGVPIDTPMISFPTDDFSAFRVATGLAYPAKAERARRNPRVGLLAEGGAGEPVVAICGMAALQDASIQANTDLYLEETGFMRVAMEPWPVAKHALWYWSRLIINIAPAHILWWESPAMDQPPQRWSAAPGTVFPKSDPAPASPASKPLDRPSPPWRELTETPISLNLPGHLTICDAEGFPIPVRAAEIAVIEDGFTMRLPKFLPWTVKGAATLTYWGRETFVGEVSERGTLTHLKVERALPINPFMGDPREVWEPKPETKAAMLGRLNAELARRNQPIPKIPDEEPFPGSRNGKTRMSKMQGAMQGLPPME